MSGTWEIDPPLALLILSLAYALALSAMGFLIGSVAKSDNGVVILTLVPMFVLSGWGVAWVPLEFTSESINRLAHVITPIAWAMDGFRDIVVWGYGVEAVLMPVGVLLLWALGLFGLGLVAAALRGIAVSAQPDHAMQFVLEIVRWRCRDCT